MTIRRTILKQELVMKLYPDSISTRAALQQFRREMYMCPELKEKLSTLGSLRRHFYTKAQLVIILEHLCISIEEFERL